MFIESITKSSKINSYLSMFDNEISAVSSRYQYKNKQKIDRTSSNHPSEGL